MTMTELEALKARHSVKHYHDTALTPADRAALHDLLARVNAESGLALQLIEDEPQVFRTFASAATGLISARHYFAMVGPRGADLERQIGYWGQSVVLHAQMLGLRTNWTGGSRRLRLSTASVAPGQKLVIVIAVGYGHNDGKSRSTRPVEELAIVPDGWSEVPQWFHAAMEAAQLAPTGFNRQKFVIELREDGYCDARATSRMPQTDIDLGIVMKNFEIGAAGSGHRVEWVNPVV